MKNPTLIIFICFLTLQFESSGQSYIPFPEDSAQWCIEYGEAFTDWNYSNDGFYAYKIKGDTIISGKNFKNIAVVRNWFQYTDFSGDVGWHYGDYELGYCGAIREEDKKIYFYRYDSVSPSMPKFYTIPVNNEVLLYDFNLNLGDTAEIGDVYVVILIDSVLCNDGIYHKHFYLENYYYYTEWLEGIGDINNGLFGPFIFEFEGFGWTFHGFLKDSVNVYGSAGCYEGGFDAISDLQENNFILYFENENTLVIKTVSYLQDCIVEIFDVSGKRVFSTSFSGNESKINLSSISIGLYLVKISSEHKILKTEKIYKK